MSSGATTSTATGAATSAATAAIAAAAATTTASAASAAVSTAAATAATVASTASAATAADPSPPPPPPYPSPPPLPNLPYIIQIHTVRGFDYTTMLLLGIIAVFVLTALRRLFVECWRDEGEVVMWVQLSPGATPQPSPERGAPAADLRDRGRAGRGAEPGTEPGAEPARAAADCLSTPPRSPGILGEQTWSTAGGGGSTWYSPAAAPDAAALY